MQDVNARAAHPQSEAQRQHIHGRLHGFERPDGEPSLLAGACILGGVAVLVSLGIGFADIVFP